MLRARQRFGKYIIERRIAEGGFAAVFQASDTIEGIRVALKVPHSHLLNDSTMACFKQEARLAAKLDHPNILPLKNADMIDGKLVLVTSLGESSLEQRLQKRLALQTSIDYAEQMLTATAYAHEKKIIHCDIKPDNLLIFPNNQLVLSDFGIARVAYRTLQGSGAGTIGYVAPEQAMGKPSFRSDVFSLGIVIYRMLTGCLPEWPYTWPMDGSQRLRQRVNESLVTWLKKSTEVDASKRFADAGEMLSSFQRIKRPLLASQNGTSKRTGSARGRSWQELRRKEFQVQFGTLLGTTYSCHKCDGPVSEAMLACPWCGDDRQKLPDTTNFPLQCPRCRRGVKLDWPYCAWCYGGGFEVETNRQFNDKRYTARCVNKKCSRKQLMPFMRYCPWCRCSVKRKWKIENSPATCRQCGWGVVTQYWNYCPWCVTRMDGSR
jgi:serine/threonine-protein kinase